MKVIFCLGVQYYSYCTNTSSLLFCYDKPFSPSIFSCIVSSISLEQIAPYFHLVTAEYRIKSESKSRFHPFSTT